MNTQRFLSPKSAHRGADRAAADQRGSGRRDAICPMCKEPFAYGQAPPIQMGCISIASFRMAAKKNPPPAFFLQETGVNPWYHSALPVSHDSGLTGYGRVWCGLYPDDVTVVCRSNLNPQWIQLPGLQGHVQSAIRRFLAAQAYGHPETLWSEIRSTYSPLHGPVEIILETK